MLNFNRRDRLADPADNANDRAEARDLRAAGQRQPGRRRRTGPHARRAMPRMPRGDSRAAAAASAGALEHGAKPQPRTRPRASSSSASTSSSRASRSPTATRSSSRARSRRPCTARRWRSRSRARSRATRRSTSPRSTASSWASSRRARASSSTGPDASPARSATASSIVAEGGEITGDVKRLDVSEGAASSHALPSSVAARCRAAAAVAVRGALVELKADIGSRGDSARLRSGMRLPAFALAAAPAADAAFEGRRGLLQRRRHRAVRAAARDERAERPAGARRQDDDRHARGPHQELHVSARPAEREHREPQRGDRDAGLAGGSVQLSRIQGSCVPDYIAPNHLLPAEGGTIGFEGDAWTFGPLPRDGFSAVYRTGNRRATTMPTNFGGVSVSLPRGAGDGVRVSTTRSSITTSSPTSRPTSTRSTPAASRAGPAPASRSRSGRSRWDS